VLPLLALALLALACSDDPGSGPVELHWDRDACERCRMVLSDRRFAAQVRTAAGELQRFDDVGCAVSWIAEQPGVHASEIWVQDHRDGRWLDARTAFYESVASTPMDYGYGAVSEPGAARLSFAELRERILAVPPLRRGARRTE
jgi:hypothetical protein